MLRSLAARSAILAGSVALSLIVAASPAQAGHDQFRPGAPGIGDPYFPLDGNGGYDVQHYLLDVKYTPSTDALVGTATITARATQDLSRFNLDFHGLTVRSITVDGKSATWSRSGDELTVTPKRGIRDHSKFTTVVRYDGVPESVEGAGFLHTDDGAVVVGQPHVASSWFPVNDHPLDKASYTFVVTVPAGLEAVSNGVLESTRTRGGWSTWTWQAREPMASYLATATVGQFNLHAYQKNGIKFWDAIDPDLYTPIATPHSGTQLALSQIASLTYKRLAHTFTVPVGGSQLSFWVNRDTEQNWDFLFVEAHTVGQDDWTTLPDANGHTSNDLGNPCPFWLELHPFLTHYQTDNGDDTCSPTGSGGGAWNAATGNSGGYEQWRVDLGAYAGKNVEVSITYASDDTVQARGVYVDDIAVTSGAGSTSFENDGDVMDGWTVPGAPAGSEPNENDWIVGTAADGPEPEGPIVEGSFARQPEIIKFLSSTFGPYPFSAGGGIVDDIAGVGFALENQTRPIYAREFFTDPVSGDNVVVHEIAHQWYGDNLAVAGWQHIWLNEGFATYAEWLWSEYDGLGTAQEVFDSFYDGIPASNSFWQLTIGDPGPDNVFEIPVYWRGGMALHQLRLAVGDRDFFTILRRWASTRAGGNVTIPEFIALAERISGKQLDDLFNTWLFTPGKPVLPSAAAGSAAGSAADSAARAAAGRKVPPVAADGLKRLRAATRDHR